MQEIIVLHFSVLLVGKLFAICRICVATFVIEQRYIYQVIDDLN
jgi:predicted GNAT family N-acyltransferase